MKIIASLFICLLCSSCSSYIARMYKELDESDNQKRSNRYDQFDIYRKGNAAMGEKTEKTISSREYQQVSVPVKRQYQSPEGGRQRYKADDLIDKENTGSLWAETDTSNSLYASENIYRPGDIVRINVMAKLKQEIGHELNRAFAAPVPNRGTSGPVTPDGPSNTAEATTTSQEVLPGADQQVYDYVSGIISEEISNNYFLLKGRKHLLYRNQKKLIEIQALVAKKDIQQEGVNSDRFLETTIHVLR